MPRTAPPANVLVVEGPDDVHSVIGLMRAHIPWPAPRDQAPVEVLDGRGKDAILVEGYLTALVRERGRRSLGVVLDADENAQAI